MRLLIVSPRFPPSSAPDSQRVRMLLPYFAENGIEAEVLAVDAGSVATPTDTWQVEHLPPNLPIHRVKGLSLRWASIPGLGGIDARCHRDLAATGTALLKQRHFDAVFFSTTEFGTFRLGPLWKQRHGTPFLLDFQDPWVNDYYRLHPEVPPPGGQLKYRMVRYLSLWQQPRVLRQAAGYIAVSGAYPADLQARYPFAADIPSMILPFPGSVADFQHLSAIDTNQLPFDPNDGFIHWVSIGRGGADLQKALGALFEAISSFPSSDLMQRLRLHFLGTSYAPAGRRAFSIQSLASSYGLAEIVLEKPERLPLSLGLATLKAAHALVVIGSNDPGYTASKLYPYLLARRPLLAVIHEQSSVADVLQRCGGGQLVTFSEKTTTSQVSQAIQSAWLHDDAHTRITPLDDRAFETHTAPAQARQLVSFLKQCI